MRLRTKRSFTFILKALRILKMWLIGKQWRRYWNSKSRRGSEQEICQWKVKNIVRDGKIWWHTQDWALKGKVGKVVWKCLWEARGTPTPILRLKMCIWVMDKKQNKTKQSMPGMLQVKWCWIKSVSVRAKRWKGHLEDVF